MRNQPAPTVQEAALAGRHARAGINRCRLAPNSARVREQRPDVVDGHRGRRIDLPGAQRRMHRAGHGAVENRSDPAAMYRAHRVEEGKGRPPGENHPAFGNLGKCDLIVGAKGGAGRWPFITISSVSLPESPASFSRGKGCGESGDGGAMVIYEAPQQC